MPNTVRCAIEGCDSNSDEKDTTFSFHCFPRDEETRNQWISATNKPLFWKPNKKSVICSKHFSKDDFRTKSTKRLLLKRGAAPKPYGLTSDFTLQSSNITENQCEIEVKLIYTKDFTTAIIKRQPKLDNPVPIMLFRGAEFDRNQFVYHLNRGVQTEFSKAKGSQFIARIASRNAMSGPEKPKSVGCGRFSLPARYALVILLSFGTCLSFVFRTNTSLTIVAMVNQTRDAGLNNCTLEELDLIRSCQNDTSSLDSTCPDPNLHKQQNQTNNEEPKGSYEWSSEMQGLVLGGFFYGYACTQLVMGRLADKLGPKWLIGTGMLLGSVFTALVPLAAHLGVIYLVILRIVTGMTQGVMYPGLTTLFIRWIPEGERSLAYSITSVGASMGIILCMPIVGWLCKQTSFADGWPSVFYIFGACGGLWSIIWLLASSNDPASHPRISPKERDYILRCIPDHGLDPKSQPRVPWKRLLRSRPVWAYVFSFSCSSWVYYTRLTELPNYLDQILHSPIEENGYINAFVNFVSMFFSLLCGYVSDKILTNKWMSKTKTRKLVECTALVGSSGCLFGVVVSGCNSTAVIAFLTLASGFLALSNSGDCILAMDLAPALSGTIFGIANTFCSVTGFVSPLLTGVVLDNDEMSLTLKWQIVFYMSISIGLAGALVALFFWSGEVQPWDPTYHENDTNQLPDQEHFHVDYDKNALISRRELKKF